MNGNAFIVHTNSSLNAELADINQQMKELQTRKNEILKKISAENRRVADRQAPRYGDTSKITAKRRYESAKVSPRYSHTELSNFVPVGRQNPKTGQQELYYATKVNDVYKKKGKTYKVKRTT